MWYIWTELSCFNPKYVFFFFFFFVLPKPSQVLPKHNPWQSDNTFNSTNVILCQNVWSKLYFESLAGHCLIPIIANLMEPFLHWHWEEGEQTKRPYVMSLEWDSISFPTWTYAILYLHVHPTGLNSCIIYESMYEHLLVADSSFIFHYSLSWKQERWNCLTHHDWAVSKRPCLTN